ncbi:hypothetical protein RQP53_12450 [Paucibacter sp. APW11]|uniref:Uncharacterized protein n=1 Tax=Roseateles aquae TaxID=3077235 RepID=A0ABU3PC33_9BURK|nr:hypothetical protein [Paucibacter sp. APW11]MDT9000078.1 hypothetical protein [Paucibacter sp. APW11]
MNDQMAMLQALGFQWPSPAYIFGAILFGLIGLAAFRLGRVRQRPRTRWLGLALMLYPYLVSQTWLLYLIGLALCAGIYTDRD